MTNLELEEIKKEMMRAIQKQAERYFEYFVKEGWIVLPDKKLKLSDRVEFTQFKDGAEFGKYFGRAVEMKMEQFFDEYKIQ